MSDLVREMEIWVHTLQDRPENNKEIKMEVGVEDSLHIEFEYQRSKYVWGTQCSFLYQKSIHGELNAV
jgi:hypothetical protein